jgi:hypothetical protein
VINLAGCSIISIITHDSKKVKEESTGVSRNRLLLHNIRHALMLTSLTGSIDSLLGYSDVLQVLGRQSSVGVGISFSQTVSEAKGIQ